MGTSYSYWILTGPWFALRSWAHLTEVCHHLALVEILAGAAASQAQRTQLLELRRGGGGAGRARRLLLPRARRQAPGAPLCAAAGASAHGVRPRGQAETAPEAGVLVRKLSQLS